MIAGTPLERDAQGHGRSRRGTGGDVGVPDGRGGLDKAGVEAEGRTAPLVAAFVKAFTAAKQAAFNDHEGTATSSQQKSLRSASRWREAEFGGASTTREETWITMEILAHSVRWSEMCGRWLSYTRDR
ncbi:unnamed protein product, partial [Ascophyllum nodosum]